MWLERQLVRQQRPPWVRAHAHWLRNPRKGFLGKGRLWVPRMRGADRVNWRPGAIPGGGTGPESGRAWRPEPRGVIWQVYGQGVRDGNWAKTSRAKLSATGSPEEFRAGGRLGQHSGGGKGPGSQGAISREAGEGLGSGSEDLGPPPARRGAPELSAAPRAATRWQQRLAERRLPRVRLGRGGPPRWGTGRRGGVSFFF